jgi:alpha-tubulin suppressor-like RCC1 family protein
LVSVGGTVVQVDSEAGHTCVLLNTGAVRCWAQNNVGQLGYGHVDIIGNDELPSSAGDVSLSSDADYIAVGHTHSCALLDTGLVQCWGENGAGQLGYGHQNDIGDDESPSTQSPVSAGGTVEQLAAGGNHTCALLDTGDVRCWGAGSYGQLGYGNTTHVGDNESITSAGTVSVGGTVVQLAAGALHTCALLDTGAVRCWGIGSQGRLGYGNSNNIGDNELPSSAGDVPLGGTAIQITAGASHTCALLDTGAVRCWGQDSYHQLGYTGGISHIGDNELPSSAGDVNVGGAVAEVAAGSIHTCAMLEAGGIRCWGNGYNGPLGYGNRDTIGDDETPASAGDVPYLGLV